ncbi:MAG: TetR/AcrR family transcriptional regulator [Myxococcota bacterium]
MARVAAKDRDAFVESRQQEILEAALKLFARGGTDATSMDAIAREVGLSKGTLYLYFESKQAIFEELVGRFSLRPDVEYLVDHLRDRPLEEVVRFLVKATWARLHEREEMVRLLIRELPRHLDHAAEFLEKVVLPTNLLFAGFLEEKLGPERAAALNTVVAGRSLLGMVLVFFLTQKVLGGDRLLPVPEGDVVDTISELFLHGALGAA